MRLKLRLYIDDLRTPKSKDWIVVRSSAEAIEFMKVNGCPDYISFDHDLGGDDTGMKVVKWMIEQDLNLKGKFIPMNFEFNVHSANPVGSENIRALIEGYLQSRD